MVPVENSPVDSEAFPKGSQPSRQGAGRFSVLPHSSSAFRAPPCAFHCPNIPQEPEAKRV